MAEITEYDEIISELTRLTNGTIALRKIAPEGDSKLFDDLIPKCEAALFAARSHCAGERDEIVRIRKLERTRRGEEDDVV